MPKVTYIEHGGAEHEVEVPVGWTLMQAALRDGIDGIEGECGGSCACATCHVYIDEADFAKLPAPSENEAKLLNTTAAERLPTSRLGCQIKMTEELAGLVVRLPECQS